MKIDRITHILIILITFIILFISSSILNAAVFSDNFDDGDADGWTSNAGTWSVVGGEYDVSVQVTNGNAVSIVDSSVGGDATIYVDIFTQNEEPRNAFVVFDYQGPTDYKIVGGYVWGSNKWNWGRVTSSTAFTQEFKIFEPIDPERWYRLKVEIIGTTVRLYVDSDRDGGYVYKGEYTYPSMGTGGVGVGVVEATNSRFDNFSATFPDPPGTPELTISRPDAVGDTVSAGDIYSIEYTLLDTDDSVTAAFYYDTDNTGLDGTAIAGGCATAAEGTNVTCSWNTSAMADGSYYIYGIADDGVNPQVSAYSAGQVTIGEPPPPPPGMPSYEKFNSVTDNLSKPQKVALDNSENSFITVPKDNKILMYNAIGEYIKTFFGFQTPISIAVDDSNRIFVGNEATGTVVAYSLDNNEELVQLFELGTGAGEFSKPSSIAIDGSSGNIYVADMNEDVVRIYSSSGAFSGSFGTSGSGDGQFNKPVSLAIDENLGEIMVLDRQLVLDTLGIDELEGARIQVFNMSGVFQRTFGTTGWDEGQMKRPQGIEIDESSRVYIIDSLFQFIYIFDNNGVYLGKISDVIEPIRSPMGIAIGRSERVFITSITRDKYDIYRVSDADSAYISASPKADNFAIVDVNSVSAARTVGVFNLGNLGFTVGSSTITGADAADFSIQSNNCSGTLGASSDCTINVVFAPSIMGAKNASLEIPNDAPNEGTVVIPLTGTANDLPVAAIGGSSSGVEGQEIVFGGSGSTDSEGSITRYEWDVDGDGTYEYDSASPTQSHTYSGNAAYTVGLRVTDENNATNVGTAIIDISDTAPTAAFSADATTGDTPLTVTFSNASSGYDAPLRYEWDFNDDGFVDSELENPVINYDVAGTYTVSLKVRDSDNTIHTETKSDFIVAITADSDGDGILDDGDGSGSTTDNLCTGGNTVNCDDNCVSTPNADQADTDSNGVGDVCEICEDPVKVGSTYYTSIQSAYDAAADGSTILVQSAVYINDIVFDDDAGQKSVTISGGYDCTYENNTGMSTLTGINMTINFGTVSLENIILE